MGLRTDLLASPTFLPSGGGPNILGQLIAGGLDIVGQLVGTKFGATTSPAAGLGFAGQSLVPTAGSGGGLGIAIVGPAIIAAGGRIVGTVIQITRAGWAAIPSLIKQAAIALGLTVALTDIEVDIFGNGAGGGLSMAQQRKIDKFQTMTSAGVPPNIAARATGIGRKRRRGISAFELRGFRRISHLLSHVGMVPRGLRGARVRRHHHHKA